MAGVAIIERPPRALARYLQHRASDHDARIVAATEWFAAALVAADRGEIGGAHRPGLHVGAQPEPWPVSGDHRSKAVPVASEAQAAQAIAQARPGDVITFEPGTYRFADANIAITNPGKADAPIVVRARQPGSVVLEMGVSEGFVVSAPYWTFDNLTIRGVCTQDADCEHAFHVVGGATNFVARNNTLVDFNAHIKVNGQDRRFPDHGMVRGNTITNTHVRRTDKPVTPIDIVAASGWTIHGNLITDFIKASGDRVSYGAFAKGGGADNRFERNVVLCEYLLRGAPGQRVGLSLGGGGSGGDAGRSYCRGGACIPEQSGGLVESNLIASCSDEGIYINRGATSRVVHNTLLDTGGIMVRFAESGVEVEGNLVDGAILGRDDALLHAGDNLQTGLISLYLGRHPQRAWFRDVSALDLAWHTQAPRLRSIATTASADLCGSKRPLLPAYGAFEDFAACIAPTGAKP